MTYSAWSTDRSPHYWCGKVIEMFAVSPTLLMINLAGVLSPQIGRKTVDPDGILTPVEENR